MGLGESLVSGLVTHHPPKSLTREEGKHEQSRHRALGVREAADPTEGGEAGRL